MNPQSTLLLVGANDETVHKAAHLGLHVLLLQHPSKLTAAQQERAERTLVLDYTDWAQVRPAAQELWAAPGFAAALSLTEAGLENAGRLNDLFGLGGTGYEVARRLRDKGAMRRHLAGRDPAAVAAAPLRGRGDLTAFAARHGYPFIVKPADGTASLGVFRVQGPADAEDVWARVQQLRGTRTDRVSTLFVLQDFLMEEYVEGPEYSVESLSYAGRHVVVAVTEKFVEPRTFTELGHAVPARLGPAAVRQVHARVSTFLDLVGLRDGVCHTEVRLGPRGPAIIESHNRVAGDAITDLVRGACGIDLVTHALGGPFGLLPELAGPPEATAGASTRFLVGEPGRVESVSGTEEALGRPDVLDVRLSVRPGDRVRALRDNWDRLGLVAVTGPDTEAALRRGAELIRDTVEIRIARDGGGSTRAHAAALPAPAAIPAPATGDPAPAAGDPAPADGGPSPASGDPARTAGDPAPATGNPAPAAGRPSPGAGNPAPAAGVPAPAAGRPAPATGRPSPAAGAPARTAEDPSPATGHPAPATGDSAPAAGVPARTAGGTA